MDATNQDATNQDDRYALREVEYLIRPSLRQTVDATDPLSLPPTNLRRLQVFLSFFAIIRHFVGVFASEKIAGRKARTSNAITAAWSCRTVSHRGSTRTAMSCL